MEKLPNLSVIDSKPLTTFVQVDTKTFKDVVQRLTGPSEGAAAETTAAKATTVGVKKPAFKLHERRQYKGKLEIIKPPLNSKQGAAGFQQQLCSPEEQRFYPYKSGDGNGFLQLSPLSTPTKCFSTLSLVERDERGESTVPDLTTKRAIA